MLGSVRTSSLLSHPAIRAGLLHARRTCGRTIENATKSPGEREDHADALGAEAVVTVRGRVEGVADRRRAVSLGQLQVALAVGSIVLAAVDGERALVPADAERDRVALAVAEVQRRLDPALARGAKRRRGRAHA